VALDRRARGIETLDRRAEALADLETPLSLYLKLAQSERNGANSFLLESVVGGERFGRYSFIGLPARTLLRTRNGVAEVVRDGTVVYTGALSSLKRFKDDVREVREGLECGIGIENFNDLKEGDIIEAYELETIRPSLT